MSVCQKCGVKGYVKRLLYCVKCKVSSEHSYCLDILPKKGDKNVIWTCEECSLRDAKPNPTPIRSARLSQAAEIKLNRIKVRKQTIFSTVNTKAYRDADTLTDIKQPAGDCSSQKEEIKRMPSVSHNIGNEKLKKTKRRLAFEDSSSDEKSESVKCFEVEHSQLDPVVSPHLLGLSHEMSYSEANKYIPAQPIMDQIWRGFLSIQNRKNPTFIGLVAHLSSKACPKVQDVAKALPMQLNLAIFSRLEAWPQKFQTSPPTDESIALYFFPEQERDEIFFDNLIDDLIIHDQALKVVINNVELLVFSSRELPPEHWRFCRKYYLWGVFKPTNNIFPQSNAKICDAYSPHKQC